MSNDEKLQNSKSLLLTNMITFELIIAFIFTIVMPVYMRVQSQKEKILTLLGSFPNDKLEALIDRYSSLLLKRFEQTELNVDHLNLVNVVNDNPKKHTQSVMSRLKKFSIAIFIPVAFAFLLLSIYTSVNLFYCYPKLD
jgi:predicted PurR-regulated permease PerM